MPLIRPGQVAMVPTSVSVLGVGATASIGPNGKVTFSGATDISLNGVFTSAYDNYVIIWEAIRRDGNTPVIRYRASGTDATASSYNNQMFVMANTSTSGTNRYTSVSYVQPIGEPGTECGSAFMLYCFGPFLAQPTASRSITVAGGDTGNPTPLTTIFDGSSTHTVSASYDGFTIVNGGTNGFTGTVSVHGFNQ